MQKTYLQLVKNYFIVIIKVFECILYQNLCFNKQIIYLECEKHIITNILLMFFSLSLYVCLLET